MNLPLKVGFVGKRGEGALQCFRVMPETEVAAFCTRHEETVRPIADRYNIPQAYTRFEDLLGSDVDIIFVGSPLPDHVTQSTTYRLKPGRSLRHLHPKVRIRPPTFVTIQILLDHLRSSPILS